MNSKFHIKNEAKQQQQQHQQKPFSLQDQICKTMIRIKFFKKMTGVLLKCKNFFKKLHPIVPHFHSLCNNKKFFKKNNILLLYYGKMNLWAQV